MTDTSVFHGVNIPVRSVSLPSRLQLNSIESELNELKTFKQSSASGTIDGEIICTGFTRLANLYNNIEEIIQSTSTQQALHRQQNVKLVEDVLDYSVGLLDACGNARDLIMVMKEQVNDLQSALRRKRGDSSTVSNIVAYISFRKKLKKNIAKSLKVLKKLECNNNNVAFPLFGVDCQLSMVVKALRESNSIAILMFVSLLSYLSMPVMKTKAGGWSLISNLIAVAAERSHKIFNEVGIVDFTLNTLHGQIRKNDNKIDVPTETRRLETLSGSINGVEAGLDCLFRCLIRNRVSLLNILSP